MWKVIHYKETKNGKSTEARADEDVVWRWRELLSVCLLFLYLLHSTLFSGWNIQIFLIALSYLVLLFIQGYKFKLDIFHRP